jgi:hypothetical protein
MKGFSLSRNSLAMLAILMAALFLRLWGIHFGLPFLYHADEPVVVNHALAYGMGDLNPHFFNIPPLVSYLLFICYGLYFFLGRGMGIFQSLSDFEHLFYLDPTSFYLIARIIFGALLGTVTVYGAYRFVKRVSGETTALWASFFLAVNFLHVRDSHYVYADIPLVLVLLSGFFVLARIIGKPAALHWHLWAGGAIGLATATKYNGVFLLIPYLWICFRSVPWKQWIPAWGLAGMAALGVFFALNPFAILDYSFFLKELAEQSASNQGGLPLLHHLTYSLAGAMGWPMLVIALLGTLGALLSKDRMSQGVAVFVLGYYAVLCRFGQPYDRYVLPLLPFMLILAAQILMGLKKRSSLLFWMLIPFAVLPSILKTIHWDQLMSKPDVRMVAKDWAESSIPDGSRLALDWGFYMPRLAFSPSQLEEKKAKAQAGSHSAAKIRRIDALLSRSKSPSYEIFFLSEAEKPSGFLFGEPLILFNVKSLREQGIEYVFLIDALRPAGDPFLEELRREADRVMTFSPFHDPEDLGIHDLQTMTGGPFLWKDILPRARNGYPITVYRIRS